MTILQKIANYAQYRRNLRELSSLDASQLRDIGINRYDIRAIARAGSK